MHAVEEMWPKLGAKVMKVVIVLLVLTLMMTCAAARGGEGHGGRGHGVDGHGHGHGVGGYAGGGGVHGRVIAVHGINTHCWCNSSNLSDAWLHSIMCVCLCFLMATFF
jgi:hypothetical protein